MSRQPQRMRGAMHGKKVSVGNTATFMYRSDRDTLRNIFVISQTSRRWKKQLVFSSTMVHLKYVTLFSKCSSSFSSGVGWRVNKFFGKSLASQDIIMGPLRSVHKNIIECHILSEFFFALKKL